MVALSFATLQLSSDDVELLVTARAIGNLWLCLSREERIATTGTGKELLPKHDALTLHGTIHVGHDRVVDQVRDITHL